MDTVLNIKKRSKIYLRRVQNELLLSKIVQTWLWKLQPALAQRLKPIQCTTKLDENLRLYVTSIYHYFKFSKNLNKHKCFVEWDNFFKYQEHCALHSYASLFHVIFTNIFMFTCIYFSDHCCWYFQALFSHYDKATFSFIGTNTRVTK